MTVTVLSGLIRPLVEGRLPDWVEPRFFQSKEEAMTLAPEAEIGWFDMYDKKDMAAAVTAATRMKWLNSIYAGVDGLPLDLLNERGTVVTNGAGINAITIAEYVVMGMLTVAKGYRDVVRAQERREWLMDSPGKVRQLCSKARRPLPQRPDVPPCAALFEREGIVNRSLARGDAALDPGNGCAQFLEHRCCQGEILMP